MNKSKPIEVVQLSDPHFYADKAGGLYGLNSRDAFNDVVAGVIKNPVDLSLLTGDLVHDETEAGYALLKESLSMLECPVYCLPGNHDNAEFMAKAFNQTAFSCAKIIEQGNWLVVMLSSQVPGEVGGCLSDDEIVFFNDVLSKNKDKHTLVCLHHHPVVIGSKWLDQIGLVNSDQFFGIIADHPQVKAVLWGHVHQEFDEVRAGVRLLSCPSTCVQFKPKQSKFKLDSLAQGYRWLKLYKDGFLETGVKRLEAIPGTIDFSAKGY